MTRRCRRPSVAGDPPHGDACPSSSCPAWRFPSRLGDGRCARVGAARRDPRRWVGGPSSRPSPSPSTRRASRRASDARACSAYGRSSYARGRTRSRSRGDRGVPVQGRSGANEAPPPRRGAALRCLRARRASGGRAECAGPRSSSRAHPASRSRSRATQGPRPRLPPSWYFVSTQGEVSMRSASWASRNIALSTE